MFGLSTWKIIVFAVMLSIFALSAIILNKFLDVLLMAAVTAYLATPITDRIYAMGKKAPTHVRKITGNHSFAAFVAFIVIIIPFVFAILQTVNMISNPQGTQVFLDILYFSPEFSGKVKQILDTMGLEAFSDTISQRIRELMADLLSASAATVASLAGGMIIGIPVYLISTYYFIDDGPKLFRRIKSYVPKKQKFIRDLFEETALISRSLFVGFFLTSVIVGIIATAGFWTMSLLGIFELKSFAYAVFIGLITTIFVFLPIVGAPTVYLPAAAWILMTQKMPAAGLNALIMILFGVIFLNLIPDFFIRPKLMGRGTRIHPLIIILGFLGGTTLWGIKGFILGPLALALAQAVIETFVKCQEEERTIPHKKYQGS